MTRWGIAIDQLLLVQAERNAASERRAYFREKGAEHRERLRAGEPRGGRRQRSRALEPKASA